MNGDGHEAEDAVRGAHPSEDFWTDLLHGMLPRDEVDRAVQHASVCIDCDRQFRQQAAEFELIRALPVPGMRRGTSGSGVVAMRRKPWKRPWWGVAAAAVLATVLIDRWGGERTTQLEYWIPSDAAHVQVRDATITDLAQALQAYEARDAERSLVLLRQADPPPELAPLRDLYLASAFTLSHRYPEALEVLARLEISLLPQPWRDDAMWIRYIALAGGGHDAEAALFLDELADRPGPLGDRARDERSR